MNLLWFSWAIRNGLNIFMLVQPKLKKWNWKRRGSKENFLDLFFVVFLINWEKQDEIHR